MSECRDWTSQKEPLSGWPPTPQATVWGLVVFAGESYVQCPLTTDLNALSLFLETVGPGMVPTQGTAVGRAVETCWNGFDEQSEASRAIVVLTDGENHEDDVVAASRAVATEGGSVHFIGVATLDGAPIPAFDSRGRPSGFRTDGQGQPVVSRLDESTLIEAAQAGSGTYTACFVRVRGTLSPPAIQN